jgi:hypothetical protein
VAELGMYMCVCLCREEDKVVPIGPTCIASEGRRGERILGDTGRQRGMERICVAIKPLRLQELCCIYKAQCDEEGGWLFT